MQLQQGNTYISPHNFSTAWTELVASQHIVGEDGIVSLHNALRECCLLLCTQIYFRRINLIPFNEMLFSLSAFLFVIVESTLEDRHFTSCFCTNSAKPSISDPRRITRYKLMEMFLPLSEMLREKFKWYI